MSERSILLTGFPSNELARRVLPRLLENQSSGACDVAGARAVCRPRPRVALRPALRAAPSAPRCSSATSRGSTYPCRVASTSTLLRASMSSTTALPSRTAVRLSRWPSASTSAAPSRCSSWHGRPTTSSAWCTGPPSGPQGKAGAWCARTELIPAALQPARVHPSSGREADRRVREEVPVTVLRTAMLVGDSRTGRLARTCVRDS